MATSTRARSPSLSPQGPADWLEVRDGMPHSSCPIALLSDLFSRYGDVIRYKTRSSAFYLLSHPTDVRRVLYSENYVRGPLLRTVLGDGLLAADGPYWERQRRLMLPEFKQHHVQKIVGIFAQVANERVTAWAEKGAPPDQLNLTREMDRIALSNVSRALFGGEPDDRFLDDFGYVIRQLGRISNAAVFGYSLILGAGDNRRFRDAMQNMEAHIERLTCGQSSQGTGEPNLLSVLQQARNGPSGQTLTPRQIRDEVVTMITAGHETTAVTLCWAWYVILSHPHVAARFYSEVDQVLGSRPITPDDLLRLRYTRMIIDETLRMYPPVWLVGRVALRDDTSGRFPIPAGTSVLISPYLIHRHPEHWPDPEKFEPERFAAGSDAYDADQYLPFLSGRHLCLGKYFALTETVVVLATIAQRRRFHLIDPQPVAFDPHISLRMRGDLMVEVQ
jgi:cytochrome P450